MELIKFKYDKGITYCPKCEEYADCHECNSKLNYCPHCGETIERHETFIVLTVEKYHGWDKVANHTATLIIDGRDCATAHIEEDEDKSGDVAHIQLLYSARDNGHQTEVYASIISAFAKWVRFDWQNPDKVTDLPTLTRLIGFTTDKRYGMPWRTEKWIALWDVTKIQPEHLIYEFTSKEIV